MSDDKIKLWELVKKNKPWAVQIIQNILAVAEMIPLRLYDSKKASEVWNKDAGFSLEALSECGEQYPKNFNILKGQKNLIEYFGKRQNSPWVTRSSYIHPLIAEFHHQFPIFRIWEQIFIYSWTQQIKKEEKTSKRWQIQPFFDYMQIGIREIHIGGFKGFLVAGPVFTPPFKKSTEEFTNDRVNPFIEGMLEGLADDYKEKCSVLALHRPWCHKDDFCNALAKSARAMESVLDCKISNQLTFQRYICRYLALTARVLYSRTLENEIRNMVLSGQYKGDLDSVLKNIGLSFPMPHPEKPHCIYAVWKDHKWEIEVKQKDAEQKEASESEFIKIKLALRKSRLSGFGHSNLVPSKFLIEPDREACNDPVKIAEHSIGALYWGLYRRIVSIEETYAQERLAILRESFDHKLEFLPAETENHGKKYLKNLCDKFSREVAILMNADAGSIHLYEVSEDTLILGGYYSPENKLEKSIKSLAEVSRKQKQDIMFRVLQDGKAHFCKAVFVQENQPPVFDPPEESIPLQITENVKSAIYAPLRIHGRILGIIGVLGSSQYQFRSHNVQLLMRICRSIAPYIYQAIFLSAIRDLTKQAVAISSEEQEKLLYSAICTQFSKIFLSYSAVLWEPDRKTPQHFFPRVWMNNRSELEEMLAKQRKDVYLDINDPTSFIKKGLDKLKKNPVAPFVSVRFEADLDHHRMKRHHQWLKNKRIEHITPIPIKSSKNGEIISLMVLYHCQAGGLDKQWWSIGQFMADFLALLLEARMVYKQWEQRVRNTITHDIRTQIKGIQHRANDILNGLPEKYMISTSSEHGRIRTPIYKVVNDMASYAKHLNRLLNVFEDKGAFDIMKKSHIHPLLIMHKIDPESDEKVNLRNMFNKVLRPTWSERWEKKLKDNYDGPAKGPYLLIPPSYLRNILENLVNNAVKYALPKTSIDAAVKITKCSVEFRLSNMAECLKEEGENFSIFNEGYRGTNTTNIKGDGLGLTHARLYCELADGEVSVDISEKRGGHCLFTFIVSLPRKGRLIEMN